MSPATGPCSDFESNDIGVREVDATTQIGESLQKSGNGTISSDFTWNEPAADSKGAVNTDQTFGSEPETFVVTYTGLDYIINGVKHASITVQRGKRYIFDVSAVSGPHPFRLSTTPDGIFNGGTAYDVGVTYGSNEMIWDVPEDLSNSTMYYYCVYHRAMAGSGVINVID